MTCNGLKIKLLKQLLQGQFVHSFLSKPVFLHILHIHFSSFLIIGTLGTQIKLYYWVHLCYLLVQLTEKVRCAVATSVKSSSVTPSMKCVKCATHATKQHNVAFRYLVCLISDQKQKR